MAKYLILILLSLFAANLAQSQKLESKSDSLSYSLGVMVGSNFLLQDLNEINEDVFMKAFSQAYGEKKTKMSQEEANIFIQNYFNQLSNKKAGSNLEDGKAFLDENAKQDGVVVLNSGLQYKVLDAGHGKTPKSTSTVRVHYKGMTIDGEVFENSRDTGKPAEFEVNRVIKGWTEVLQIMRTGAKYMVYIPSNLAYGERGAGDVIGPNQTLIFEIELLEIVK